MAGGYPCGFRGLKILLTETLSYVTINIYILNKEKHPNRRAYEPVHDVVIEKKYQSSVPNYGFR